MQATMRTMLLLLDMQSADQRAPRHQPSEVWYGARLLGMLGRTYVV